MLYSLNFVLPLLLFPLGGFTQETIHGAVIFSRHGDRTTKLLPPTKLTAVGSNQLYDSGGFYRSRYIDTNSTTQITGISIENVAASQLYAAAPDQDLLVTSGQAFIQGLYPPSPSISTQGYGSMEILANGSKVTSPLSGYQYVTVHSIPPTDSSTIWLKGDDGCPGSAVAGNQLFVSEQYARLEASTKGFYESFSDILDGLFPRNNMSYANAYAIFDYINVGVIHNDTIASRVSPAELHQLQTLADSHEWALNGNITSVANPGVLPMSGRTFANEVVTQLSSIISSKGTSKFSLLVGSYDTFQSFFALTQLPSVNSDFFGLPGYASTIAFELISYTGGSAFPTNSDDLYVRFLFRNGTDSASPLSEYPLFGRSLADVVMTWSDFRDAIAGISVSSVPQWCKLCDSTESFCPPNSSSGTQATNPETKGPPNPLSSSSAVALSPLVVGIIGAICALVVVGAMVALAMAGFGVRFARPQKLKKVESGNSSAISRSEKV